MEKTTKKTYLLIASLSDGVTDMWVFQARHLLEVAAHITSDKWGYLPVFQRLAVVHHYDHSWENITPEQLLNLLAQAHIAGDSHYGFTFHVLEAGKIIETTELPAHPLHEEEVLPRNRQIYLRNESFANK